MTTTRELLTAAITACLHAKVTPGCLVRVTFTQADQAEETMTLIRSILGDDLDISRSIANAASGDAVLEMKNGSGIEFCEDYLSIVGNLLRDLRAKNGWARE